MPVATEQASFDVSDGRMLFDKELIAKRKEALANLSENSPSVVSILLADFGDQDVTEGRIDDRVRHACATPVRAVGGICDGEFACAVALTRVANAAMYLSSHGSHRFRLPVHFRSLSLSRERVRVRAAATSDVVLPPSHR